MLRGKKSESNRTIVNKLLLLEMKFKSNLIIETCHLGQKFETIELLVIYFHQ